MVSSSVITLLVVVLLVVPGLVGLEIYHRSAGRRSELSRLQLTVFSITLSLISLLLLYGLSPVYFSTLDSGVQYLTSLLNLVTEEELSSLALSTIVGLYAIHIALTVLLGVAVGVFDNRILNPEEVLDRRPPWQYAFNEASSEQVEVALREGSVIRGQFNEAAWSKNDHELYIEDPRMIEYEDGEQVGDPVELGRSVLLKSTSISYVLFTEEDPNSEIEIEFDEETWEGISMMIDEAIQEVGEQEDLSAFESTENEGSDDDRG